MNPESFDQAVFESAKSACYEMDRYLSARQSDQASLKELYSIMTTGCTAPGRNLVAIPASGSGTVIIPLPLKNSDIMLGKTPYETPFNMYFQKESDISHLKSDDPEKRDVAKFIQSLFGFQYSFIGTDGAGIDFSKGILIVIPDELWSYPADMILCSKDQKVSSRWTTKKSRPLHGTLKTYRGVLTPTQKYGPGSFIAISPDIQLDMWSSDYDGDIVTMITPPKDTKTFNFMTQAIKSHIPYTTPKIPKTFTPAKKASGVFEVFRFASIVQAKTANLLTSYAKIHDVFIALKHKWQEKVSKTVAKIPFISSLARNILVDESKDTIKEIIEQQPELMIQKILSTGIKTGADVFKSKVDWTYFKEFEKILTSIYGNLGIPQELIYFKKMCIRMHTKKMNFPEVLWETKYQSHFFDSLPLHILQKTLDLFPYYKQKRLSDLLAFQMSMDQSAQASLKVLSKSKNRKGLHFKKTRKEKLQNVQSFLTEEKNALQKNVMTETLLTDPLDHPIQKKEYIMNVIEDPLVLPSSFATSEKTSHDFLLEQFLTVPAIQPIIEPQSTPVVPLTSGIADNFDQYPQDFCPTDDHSAEEINLEKNSEPLENKNTQAPNGNNTEQITQSIEEDTFLAHNKIAESSFENPSQDSCLIHNSVASIPKKEFNLGAYLKFLENNEEKKFLPAEYDVDKYYMDKLKKSIDEDILLKDHKRKKNYFISNMPDHQKINVGFFQKMPFKSTIFLPDPSMDQLVHQVHRLAKNKNTLRSAFRRFL